MKDFYFEKKIYYHDTDSGGVVYYANYLKHLEEARTEYFASKGINLKNLADKNIWFIVAKVEINYKAPARYQDVLKIFVGIQRLRAAAIEFHQDILRDDTLLVEAKTRLVCVDKNFKPMSIPDEIKRTIL